VTAFLKGRLCPGSLAMQIRNKPFIFQRFVLGNGFAQALADLFDDLRIQGKAPDPGG